MLLHINQLVPDMILSEDVYDKNGTKLLTKGCHLTPRHLQYLKRYKIDTVKISHTSDNGTVDTNELPTFHVRTETEKLIDIALQKYVNDVTQNVSGSNIARIMKQIIANPDVIRHLSHMRTVDEATYQHSVKVAVLSVACGISLNLTDHSLKQLGCAALLYEIGRCHLDQALITKKSFTEQDGHLLRKHTLIGYNLLKRTFDETIATVALQHHERYNGSGYPTGLTNEEMHLFSRIVAVVDIYLALISARIYRHKCEPHEAIEYIFAAGNYLFDFQIISCFVNTVCIYPVGSLVELTDGSVGVVEQTDKQAITKPVVRLMFDKNNAPLNEYVDLSEKVNLVIKRILHT